ncbi:hypothetical protein GGR12_003191 [Brevundimonas lenta]|uniref:Uncharacterized protein n=1 Tax=Brevundimonas lenta TaxID=424796 RepID=A0A7W6NQU2_9CAUL|nr:hypothetical protein [Brevundimonas lenta]
MSEFGPRLIIPRSRWRRTALLLPLIRWLFNAGYLRPGWSMSSRDLVKVLEDWRIRHSCVSDRS